jgi:hypothetical protein
MVLSDQEVCCLVYVIHYNVVNSCCVNALELTEERTRLILYYILTLDRSENKVVSFAIHIIILLFLLLTAAHHNFHYIIST